MKRYTEYWRVFPWDPEARPGHLFSPSYVPGTTGRGRFDLPADRSPVLYVSESGEHAVAEALQPWRNRPLRPAHLERAGHRLALVRVRAPRDRLDRIADLCDPVTLVAHDVGPDRIAARERSVTQAIARGVWDAGLAGLRWWSVFRGEWHGAVLFTARLDGNLELAEPRTLDLDTLEVRGAAEALGMTVG